MRFFFKSALAALVTAADGSILPGCDGEQPKPHSKNQQLRVQQPEPDRIIPRRIGIGDQGVAYELGGKVYKFGVNSNALKSNEELLEEHETNEAIWKMFKQPGFSEEETEYFQKTELKTLAEAGCFDDGSPWQNLFPGGEWKFQKGWKNSEIPDHPNVEMLPTDLVLISDFYPLTMEEIVEIDPGEVHRQLYAAFEILHRAVFTHRDFHEGQVRAVGCQQKVGQKVPFTIKIIDFGPDDDMSFETDEDIQILENITIYSIGSEIARVQQMNRRNKQKNNENKTQVLLGYESSD